MPLQRTGRLVALVLGGEMAAFLLLWLTKTLERYGPALVATIMSANLLIVGLVVWAILRQRKP